jgi:mediator of RNA polymerase II transcription subunit 17, fungi type
MDQLVRALDHVGVPTRIRFRAVGDDGEELLANIIQVGQTSRIGGDVTLRIDSSRSLRFTFHAPSTLIAHLSQATLPIESVPQLVQLLRDETELCLLDRLCAVGKELTTGLNGTWFVDALTNKAVGKWDGCLL